MTTANSYRVYATYTVCLSALVEAGSSQEAYEIAKDMDGSEFKECSLGDWTIEADPELEN